MRWQNTSHSIYHLITHKKKQNKLTFGLLKLLGPPEEVSSEGRLFRWPLPSPGSPVPSPEAGAALRPSGSDWNISTVKKRSVSDFKTEVSYRCWQSKDTRRNNHQSCPCKSQVLQLIRLSKIFKSSKHRASCHQCRCLILNCILLSCHTTPSLFNTIKCYKHLGLLIKVPLYLRWHHAAPGPASPTMTGW